MLGSSWLVVGFVDFLCLAGTWLVVRATLILLVKVLLASSLSRLELLFSRESVRLCPLLLVLVVFVEFFFFYFFIVIGRTNSL